MEKDGIFVLRISGENHGKELSPKNYDIRELAAILTNVEDILYPNAKERPIITFELKNLFSRIRTMQAIIALRNIQLLETGN